jgi:hypothetical protein
MPKSDQFKAVLALLGAAVLAYKLRRELYYEVRGIAHNLLTKFS